MNRLQTIADRAGRTRSFLEREPQQAPPQRPSLKGRVILEAEWVYAGLNRKPKEGGR